MNEFTSRLPCLILIHSWWRGDFSSLALAQSCAEAPKINVMRAIDVTMVFIIQPRWADELHGLWCDHADDATREASAGVANGLAAVIGLRVNDDSAFDDRILRAGNADILNGDFVLRFAIGVGLHIAQIARVPAIRIGQAMRFSFRVVMTAGTHRIGGAAIAILMDVERVLLTRSQSFQLGHDFYGVAVLYEASFTFAFASGRRMQNGDGLLNGRRAFRCCD